MRIGVKYKALTSGGSRLSSSLTLSTILKAFSANYSNYWKVLEEIILKESELIKCFDSKGKSFL